jgi:hypothetical protein
MMFRQLLRASVATFHPPLMRAGTLLDERVKAKPQGGVDPLELTREGGIPDERRT